MELCFPKLSCSVDLPDHPLRNKAHNSVLDGGGVGTHDLVDLLAVLEEDEGGHSADAEFLGQVGDLINIDLDEEGIAVLLGEFLDLGADDLARTAPCSKGVNDDNLVALQSIIESGFAEKGSNVSDSNFPKREWGLKLT